MPTGKKIAIIGARIKADDKYRYNEKCLNKDITRRQTLNRDINVRSNFI